MIRCFGVVLIALLASACAERTALISTPTLTVLKSSRLPSPMRGDLVAPDRENLIGPLDTLQVDVFNVPDLTDSGV